MTVIDVWLVPVEPGAAERLPDDADVQRLGFAVDRDRAATARLAARRLACGPHTNWSHSGDWVAIATSPDGPVGVDIERIPAALPLGALALLGVDSLDGFVAREAAGKAAGKGLTEFWPAGIRARSLPAPAGYVAAVAAPGVDWTVRLMVRALASQADLAS